MLPLFTGGRRGHDNTVVGFTTTYGISVYTTKVICSNPVHGEVIRYNFMR
jgi:hypothetical protein